MQSLNSNSRAFRGDPAIKQRLLVALAERARAGHVEKTAVPSWNGTGGSLSACLAGSADSQAFEETLGMPRSVAAILDGLHSAVAAAPAEDLGFAFTWLASLRPGAELAHLPGAYLAWLLRNGSPADGISHSDVRALVHTVTEGHERTAQGQAPDSAWWRGSRAKALKLSDELKGQPEESSSWPALELVEAAAWPSENLTTTLDTLRVSVTRRMLRLSDEVARDVGWGSPQESLRQQYIAELEARQPVDPEHAERLGADPRYAPMLARMEQARTQYFASQPAAVLPYWEALVKLTGTDASTDSAIACELCQERRTQ